MFDPDVSVAHRLVGRDISKRDSRRRYCPALRPASVAAGAIPLLAVACGLYAHARQTDQLHDVAAERVAIVPVVRTENVIATSSPRALDLPGSIAPEETVSLQARASGYVEQRFTDIGSHVTAGEILAKIKSPELSQQVSRVRASLAQAEANWKLASATAARSSALLQRGWVSGQTWDRDRLTEGARKADLDATQAALAEALQHESYLTIRAPFDGVVTARNVEAGDLVSGDTPRARPLFVIDRTDLLRVRVDVPQESAVDVKVGMAATLSLAEHPGRSLKGRVARTAGALTPVSRTLPVDIDIDNGNGRLVAGLYVIAHIAVPRSVPVTIVKAEALLQRPDGVFVATVDHVGTIKLRRVQIGRDFGAEIEVLEGLPTKTTVVLNPTALLRDGMRVAFATEPESKS